MRKLILALTLVLGWPFVSAVLGQDCPSCIVVAQAPTVALNWTLSSADTTAACAVTGANCSQAVYRAPGACSATSVFVAINSAVAATATSYTDSTVTFGQFCYAVSFTINGATSVVFATGQTDFATVLVQPPSPTSLVATPTP